ncbi:IclR family transcriptional regulator domain-containing protein [Pseudogracilibacillus sp. SO30301A]|uniref:IclR family transcriptional regulator domain-containing protein n=1 Tax=Pseudogracilibacillus sp. SO30301A TaxID=3098291 RepID=UPI003FA7EBEB
MAVPIRNHMGEVVSSLSTIGRTSRFHEKGILKIANKIKQYAQKISELLGCY